MATSAHILRGPVGVSGAAERATRSLWSDAWRRLKKNRAAVASMFALLLIVVAAIVGPLLLPYDYAQQDLANSAIGPNVQHWLGTDVLGRDVLARLLIGARISLTVASLAQVMILSIGVPVGLIAGYKGGWIDQLLMRGVEVLQGIPGLLFIVLVMTFVRGLEASDTGPGALVIGPIDKAAGGLLGVVVGMSLYAWLPVCRLVRAQVLSLKERDFVTSARATGCSDWRIILRHLLPNCLSPVVVATAYGIPEAIFLEAGLSFMGVGAIPPMPSWGTMLSDGAKMIQGAPHLVAFPALALSLTMLCTTYISDGLRDALDPRMRGRM